MKGDESGRKSAGQDDAEESRTGPERFPKPCVGGSIPPGGTRSTSGNGSGRDGPQPARTQPGRTGRLVEEPGHPPVVIREQVGVAVQGL